MDFSNSVILPREDFIELSTVAWANPPTSLGSRLAMLAQTATFCAIVGGAFVAVTRDWTKSMRKLEDAKTANKILEAEELQKIHTK